MLFVIGFVLGALVAFAILHSRFEREIGRLRIWHSFEEDLNKRHLDYVIVKPLKEDRGGVYIAPLREPVEAVIDGHRYKKGEKLTEHLVVKWMLDEGAHTTLSPEVRLEPPPEYDVQIDDHVFHNASLMDEWHVVVGVVPDHLRYKEWDLEPLGFRMVTNRAVYEDGSDASLSRYSARFVGDGSPTTLPWQRPIGIVGFAGVGSEAVLPGPTDADVVDGGLVDVEEDSDL